MSHSAGKRAVNYLLVIFQYCQNFNKRALSLWQVKSILSFLYKILGPLKQHEQQDVEKAHLLINT